MPEHTAVAVRFIATLKIWDYFIGTHPHEDHIGGAAAILSSIKVGTVFVNGESAQGYYYEKFVDALFFENAYRFAQKQKTAHSPSRLPTE